MKKNKTALNLTIGELISKGAEELKSLPSKRVEATVLLSYVLKSNKVELYRNMLNQIDPSLSLDYKNLLKRRLAGEPLCYITGKREFYGLEFVVNENTLIPRHETEILVDEAIRFLQERKLDYAQVLELGIGSGAISIALAHHCKLIQIDAVDISKKALCVASVNIEKYLLKSRIRILEGDLFSPIEPGKKYDLIISNPPYIPSQEISTLSKEVQSEPIIALNGGIDGLTVIRKLIQKSPEYLNPDGCLMIEITGEMQEKKVTDLFYENGFKKVFQKKDLSSIPRVIGGSKLA